MLALVLRGDGSFPHPRGQGLKVLSHKIGIKINIPP